MSPTSNALEEFYRDTDAADLLARFDAASVPVHVAIIMDGNGRWAARRGLPRLAGHRAGAKAVREAIATSLELGVRYLTIYSFSSENWSRPADEVTGLMNLFVEVLERELSNLQQQKVRVIVSGRKDALPAATAKAFEACEEATRDNDRMTLVVALNYGGRVEIVDAVRSIAAEVEAGTLTSADIDESTIASHLYTPDVPDPELVIRTSGEMRVSNFLLWQIAYAEFWITETLWPDFDRVTLLEAIVDFQGRERRFGGTKS